MASSQAQARRSFALAVVIGLHVALIGALVIGTAAKFVAKQMKYIVAVDIKPEEKQEVKEPPPPPPDFHPPAVAPPPTVTDFVPVGPPSPKALAVQAPPPAPAPKVEKVEPPPVTPVQMTANGKQMLADACSERYPSASRRLSEEGVVKILVYVSPEGRVTDAKIETSSGFPRLDEANIACVKAAGKAFVPQKTGSTPVGSWQIMSYRWKLN
jgi:protein TonB